MTVVLHTGAHKTGTSLIQKFLRDRADSMADVGVVSTGRDETNSLIGWGRKVERRPERLRRRIDELLEQAPHVVVSHENSLGPPLVRGHAGLYPEASARADALASACDGLDVRVVQYVRDLPGFVESYYLQTVHEGGTAPFDMWAALIEPVGIGWRPVIEALDRAFGADRVVVGDFAEIATGQQAYISRFLERAGLPTPGAISYPVARNRSVSARGLEIALAVNPLLEEPAHRKAVRRFLQRHFSNATEPRARPMTEAVRARLEADAASEAALLRSRIEAPAR